MRFGTEILRGVRLAAIIIAVGLVGVTLYRMLDLVDDDATNESSASPAVAAGPVKPVVKASGAKFYPPPPPPLPGRSVAAKAAPQGREIVVVDVPAARDSYLAEASPAPLDPRPEPSVPAPVTAPEPAAVTADAAPAPHRNNRFVRAFRRVVRLVKPN